VKSWLFKLRPFAVASGWAGLGLLAGVLVTARWWGGVLGAIVGLLGWHWIPRGPGRDVRRSRARANADLPFGADLLAAVLEAGGSPEHAALVVAAGLGGPLGDRLARVGRALRLGAPPAEAWSHLGELDGAARLIRAVDRSGQSGAALAGLFHRVAEDLRTERLLAAEAAARRAGVLIVLPLGLCFLPAFVLTGLVPVMVAVVGGVLSTSP
jgi:pilus assembly protein TadC